MISRIIVLVILSGSASVCAQPVGAVLGWKFNHAPGIETRDTVITRWPAALGPVPTTEQLDGWRQEYNAAADNPDKQREIDRTNEELVRVTEQLLVVLLQRGAIQRGDFPPRVWTLINQRRAIRGQPPI